MKHRISIAKEDRIWDLRTQGYDYDSIARIVNVSKSLTGVIRRVRRRPPIEVDPIRRGRKAGFLSDSQVDDIRRRFANGERQADIGEHYGLSACAISHICCGRSYATPESERGYEFNFSNRLRR
jgi:hypothetical protein